MNYIIIPSEHKDLVTLQISPCEKVVPLPVIDGDYVGEFVIPASLPAVPGYEALAAALAAEPLVSAVLQDELEDSALFPPSEQPQ